MTREKRKTREKSDERDSWVGGSSAGTSRRERPRRRESGEAGSVAGTGRSGRREAAKSVEHIYTVRLTAFLVKVHDPWIIL